MSEENKTETVAGANENNTVALGLLDLQNAAQVIDIAVSRGAFRAGEIAQVGEVYNRIVAFIQSVQAQQGEASNTTTEEESNTTTEEASNTTPEAAA